MTPRIESGQLCTVEPVDPSRLVVGDVVLCRVGRADYLHFVTAIDGERFRIGNARGRANGWIDAASIFGRLARVEA